MKRLAPACLSAKLEGAFSALVLAQEGVGLAPLFAEALVARCREAGETAELFRWTAADVEAGSPSFAFRSLSFFARRRIFLLPDMADVKKKARDEILRYLEAPEESAVLVIPCSDGAAARALGGRPGVRRFAPGEEEAFRILADYAVELCARSGVVLEQDQAAFLARWVGGDFLRLKEEAAKLAGSAGKGGRIEEGGIRELCAARGRVDPFAMADALLAGEAGRCLNLFRAFARTAQERDYHALLGALAWRVRRAVSAPGSRLSPARAAGLFEGLAAVDRRMKGESGLSPEQVFEIALLKLLA